MENIWSRKEEYSHGYMIPIVAFFLLWKALPEVRRIDWRPTWWSVALMALALLGWLLGEVSTLYIIVQYSMVLALVALVLSAIGWQGLSLVWTSLLYLVFMIPFPSFIYQGLSAQLQLISTKLGVLVMRLFDTSVFVEGNVIDLGDYQLQVAEACSGLSYLFPLMSFGFLIALLYQGPRWHRWLIFLATIPVTVLMNSLRIGIIGITVEYWGIEAAEGILHAFEGWLVFMASVALLLWLIWLLNLASRDGLSVLLRIDLSYPTRQQIAAVPEGGRKTRSTLMACTILCLLAVPASIAISEREEVNPTRDQFVQFPLIKNDWIGYESSIPQNVLDSLQPTDYILAEYHRSTDPNPVNFYIAFYASQRTGTAIHSPRSCLPGGGWEITNLSQLDLGEAMGVTGLKVNRVVIQLGDQKQLVYYWMQQRGRNITSEYLAKWYLFQDGLLMGRSDGALVRLVTPIPQDGDEGLADKRLQDFLGDFYQDLPRFLPGAQP
jgi:exosortase D (VPLPA-CTERM-specific)